MLIESAVDAGLEQVDEIVLEPGEVCLEPEGRFLRHPELPQQDGGGVWMRTSDESSCEGSTLLPQLPPPLQRLG